MKVVRPAWRVRRSCASIAPSASFEIASRIFASTSLETASSISPPIDCRIELPSPPQDVQRDQRRDERIEDEPAGERHQRDADKHADRRDDVGQEVLGVGEQCRRAPALRRTRNSRRHQTALIDASQAPLIASPSAGAVERLRVEIAEIGLAQDGERGDDDQHAFEHGREIFGLVMPVGVICVGRDRARAARQRRRATAVATLTMLSSASE